MPTYEYKCEDEKCSKVWECEQRITEPAMTECPSCHKNTAKRQIGKSSFILLGGGWYADGYSK